MCKVLKRISKVLKKRGTEIPCPEDIMLLSYYSAAFIVLLCK